MRVLYYARRFSNYEVDLADFFSKESMFRMFENVLWLLLNGNLLQYIYDVQSLQNSSLSKDLYFFIRFFFNFEKEITPFRFVSLFLFYSSLFHLTIRNQQVLTTEWLSEL